MPAMRNVPETKISAQESCLNGNNLPVELTRLASTIYAWIGEEVMHRLSRNNLDRAGLAAAYAVQSLFERKVSGGQAGGDSLEKALQACANSDSSSTARIACAKLLYNLNDKHAAEQFLTNLDPKTPGALSAACLSGNLFKCGNVLEAEKLLRGSLGCSELVFLPLALRADLTAHRGEEREDLLKDCLGYAKAAQVAGSNIGRQFYLKMAQELVDCEIQPGLQNHLLKYIVDAQIKMGDRNGAIQSLQRVYLNIEQFEEDGRRAYWFGMLADLERELSSAKKIEQYIDMSLEFRRRDNPDICTLARCLAQAGAQYARIGNKVKSDHVLSESESCLPKLAGYPWGCALLHIDLAEAYFYRAEPDKAFGHLEQVVACARSEEAFRQKEALVSAVLELSLESKGLKLDVNERNRILEFGNKIRQQLPELVQSHFVSDNDRVNVLYTLALKACEFGDALGAHELINLAQTSSSFKAEAGDLVLFAKALSAVASAHPSALTAFRLFHDAFQCVTENLPDSPARVDSTLANTEPGSTDKLALVVGIMHDLLLALDKYQGKPAESA